MKHVKLLTPALSAIFLHLGAAHAAYAADPAGVWMDDTGRGAVEIKSCGKNLCGHVVAVKSASDTKGCGKQIIGDAQPAGGGLWGNGWIYSPERRKNYDVELKPLSDGTLRVVGYAGTKLFSRTMIWTRAPADLKRCDQVEAKAAPVETAKVSPPAATSKPPAVAPLETAKAESALPAPATAPHPAATQPAAPPRADAVPVPNPEPKVDEKSRPAEPSATPSQSAENPQPSPQQASPDAKADNRDGDDEDGEKPGQRKAGGGLKLGDLDLDKVLTRTKSGKCKLDLPWVKVQFDCERE